VKLSSLVTVAAFSLVLTACTSPPTSEPSTPSKGTTATKAEPAKTSEGSGVLGTLGTLAGAAATGSGGSSSSENKTGAGLDLLKAASVSDSELKAVSLQLRARDDKRAQIAGSASKQGKRLAKLTAKHTKEDGMNLNFKAYVSPEINANASADGSIRIYTGLMEKMTDAELLGVIGHEIGHVKLAHSSARLRTAYLASAGRKAAASSSGALGALADSDLGAIGEQLVKGQFSQSQETESDDYGLAFMKKHGYDVKGMESAFRKLATLSSPKGGLNEMLSSHPDAGKRADRMRDKASGK
jgi:metalloprotease